VTHRIWSSTSATALLLAQKRRPHGRQGNVGRRWKLRYVEVVHPGAFLSDHPGERNVGRLKTVGPR
jgi:hypothetical protein